MDQNILNQIGMTKIWWIIKWTKYDESNANKPNVSINDDESNGSCNDGANFG